MMKQFTEKSVCCARSEQIGQFWILSALWWKFGYNNKNQSNLVKSGIAVHLTTRQVAHKADGLDNLQLHVLAGVRPPNLRPSGSWTPSNTMLKSGSCESRSLFIQSNRYCTRTGM